MLKELALAGLMAGLSAAPALANPLASKDLIEIWPGGVGPGSEGLTLQQTVTERSNVPYWPDRILTKITRPALTAFVPDHPNGTAVIVAPGGAYMRIAIDKESSEMARWLNPYGVTVLVMSYRLPGEGHQNAADVTLEDAQRAVRVVRAHAAEWHLDPHRIGFLGASAGGHMAASLATGFDRKVYEPKDAADQLSARPDFEILLYPVISMTDKLANMDTRNQLLGAHPTEEQIAKYSPDQHVSKTVPPTFVTLAEDDSQVPPANGIGYFHKLHALGVKGELHVFKQGDHGFGIRDARQLPVSNWPNLAMAWMKTNGFVPQAAGLQAK
jgi:acetyl esterase/lipase